MKIDTITKNYSNLFEALKFTNADRSKLNELKKYFRIGIEYEFLVDSAQEDDADDHTVMHDLYGDQANREAQIQVEDEFKDCYAVMILSNIETLIENQDKLKDLSRRWARESRQMSWLRRALYQIDEDLYNAFKNVVESDEFSDEDLEDLKTAVYNFSTSGSYDSDDLKDDLVDAFKETSMYEHQVDQVSSEILDNYADDHRNNSSDSSKKNDKAVEYAKDDISYELGDDFDELIEDILEDGSLAGGAEVVSKPLNFDDTETLMDFMFKWIAEHGSTDRSCGMHVNISHASFVHDSRPNPMKMFVLMDIDFFQNVRGVLKEKIKYPPRGKYTEPVSQFIGENILDIAKEYTKSGIDGVEAKLNEALINSPRKFIAANWTSFFDTKESRKDPEQRRIEFRFFGGPNYHTRKQEIINDIIYIMHVIHTVYSGNYEREVYLKSLYKILDTASQKAKGVSFSKLVSDARKPPEQASIDNKNDHISKLRRQKIDNARQNVRMNA